MVRSRMYLARNGVVIGGQYAAYGFCNAAHRLRVAASFNKLFLKSSFQRAAEFRRRFAMARPYPRCGHAVARRAKVVFGGSRRIPLPEPGTFTEDAVLVTDIQLKGYSSTICVREGDAWKRLMQMSNVTP